MPFDPSDPNFAAAMAGCPFSWQGDAGVLNWLSKFYDIAFAEGVASVPPAWEPPRFPKDASQG